jgi:hypothetical protein
MDAISNPLISEHLQRKKSTPNLLSYFCNQYLPITFHKSCCTWWVWKTRNLTFKGETLIVKIFLLAQMGFETEMRGISGGGVEVLPVPSGDGFEAEDFYQLSRSVDIISELIKFYIVKHFRGNS